MNHKELARTIQLLDKALISESPAVKEALGKLLMLAELAEVDGQEGPLAKTINDLYSELAKMRVLQKEFEQRTTKDTYVTYGSPYSSSGTGGSSWGYNTTNWTSTS